MKSKESIYEDRMVMLTPTEKEQVRKFVGSSLYTTYLRAVSAFKPSANCANAGSGPRDQFSDSRASARLAEMRGWEQHELALQSILFDVAKPEPEPETEFPDAGQMLAEPPSPKQKRSRKNNP